jgi:hypothetical protein
MVSKSNLEDSMTVTVRMVIVLLERCANGMQNENAGALCREPYRKVWIAVSPFATLSSYLVVAK